MDRSPEDLGLAPDIALLPIEVQDLIRHGHRGQYPSHSDAAAAACAAMFWAGFGVAELWMVLTDPTHGISEAFFSMDGERAEDWLERIIFETYEAVDRSYCGEG